MLYFRLFAGIVIMLVVVDVSVGGWTDVEDVQTTKTSLRLKLAKLLESLNVYKTVSSQGHNDGLDLHDDDDDDDGNGWDGDNTSLKAKLLAVLANIKQISGKEKQALKDGVEDFSDGSLVVAIQFLLDKGLGKLLDQDSDVENDHY